MALHVVCGITMVGVGQADKTPGSWSRTPIGTDTGARRHVHLQSGIGAGPSVLFNMFSFEIQILPPFDEVISGYK